MCCVTFLSMTERNQTFDLIFLYLDTFITLIPFLQFLENTNASVLSLKNKALGFKTRLFYSVLHTVETGPVYPEAKRLDKVAGFQLIPV